MSPLWIVLTLLPFFGEAARFNCKGRILGAYYADAKSGCKAFHVCVRVAGGGVRDFRFFCPPGTLFHQEAQTCTDWGDDDPLACPVDLYDGQFDLYRIGSGFDTKKVSPPGNRDEEPEFGLQRADTSERRLSENSISSNGASSDLKTAHSSDFFSGQRDRGRDDPNPQVPQSPAQRQSFRRVPTRAPQLTTQYTQNTTPQPPTTKYSNPSHYETSSERKLVRKRPVYATTIAPPSTYSQNTIPQKSSIQLDQNFDRQTQSRLSSPSPASIPQAFKEYKEEYVEVPRVTPKSNKVVKNSANSASYSPSTPFPKFDKNGLVELYNYEAQSSPQVKDNQSFKVKHSYKVAPDYPKETDYSRTKIKPNNGVRVTSTTVPDNSGAQNIDFSTPTYKDINNVSYEPEKYNIVPFSPSKQNYYNNPATTPSTTTIFTTTRFEPQQSFNNIAYNTNNGINAKSFNYPDSGEDDGQYRPPADEDDGQYRPELYERELLSGAHSLNIAASGNRLPEDQKPRGKTQPPSKVAQTAAPRPFRPLPTTSSSRQTPRIIETITTTFSPRVTESQRTFDYFQTYTTTSRPSDTPAPFYPTQNIDVETKSPERPTTLAPRVLEARPTTRAPINPTVGPKKATSRPPHFAKPANNKEDNSYDYAYYDTDPGFSEYDNIEEFGRTKTKG